MINDLTEGSYVKIKSTLCTIGSIRTRWPAEVEGREPARGQRNNEDNVV